MFQSFPKPLDTKEEQEYLMLLKAGDKKARETLILHNLRLVAHIVKKYNLPDRDIDDLISIGTIGLIKAIDSFDMGKGIRLATYASRCIDNELLMLLRSGKKQGREVYLSEPIGADKEGNEIRLLDIMETQDEDIVSKMELQNDIKKLYYYLENCLTERERKIICRRYGLMGQSEATQREVAIETGISRSYVSRIEKKALKHLGDCFKGKY